MRRLIPLVFVAAILAASAHRAPAQTPTLDEIAAQICVDEAAAGIPLASWCTTPDPCEADPYLPGCPLDCAGPTPGPLCPPPPPPPPTGCVMCGQPVEADAATLAVGDWIEIIDQTTADAQIWNNHVPNLLAEWGITESPIGLGGKPLRYGIGGESSVAYDHGDGGMPGCFIRHSGGHRDAVLDSTTRICIGDKSITRLDMPTIPPAPTPENLCGWTLGSGRPVAGHVWGGMDRFGPDGFAYYAHHQGYNTEPGCGGYQGPEHAQLWRYSHAGGWELVRDLTLAPFFGDGGNLNFAQYPDGRLLIEDDLGFFRSDDGGATWNIVAPNHGQSGGSPSRRRYGYDANLGEFIGVARLNLFRMDPETLEQTHLFGTPASVGNLSHSAAVYLPGDDAFLVWTGTDLFTIDADGVGGWSEPMPTPFTAWWPYNTLVCYEPGVDTSLSFRWCSVSSAGSRTFIFRP